MAKYSTGGASGGGDGAACELCGEATDDLREATVAGADLLVCRSCAPHDDASDDTDDGQPESDDRVRSGTTGPPPSMEGTSELWDADSTHWEEEGAGYETDPLPYLISDYGKLVTEARQTAGLQVEELAEELGIPEEDLLAVEQGRAARAGIGGSVVTAIEERLDIELSEK